MSNPGLRAVLSTAAARVVGLTSTTARRRMTPGYLVVGTKRGGSTSLAEWITAHPEVATTRSGKGTHYFDVNFERGPQWYATQFPRVSSAPGGHTLVGESSPYYMFHPSAPQRIAAHLPDAKIIVCLRDPVERAWSHHAYEVSHGRETEDFESALALEPERLAGERERLAADPSYPADHWRFHAYLRRGHYAEQLRTYLDLYDARQILVVQSEAMFARPHEELDRVHEFLGLRAFRAPDLQARNAGRHDEIPEHLMASLRAYYAPLNDELYALPGVTFRWPYATAASTATHS